MGNQPHTPKRIHYMKTYKSTNVSPSRSISPSPTIPFKEKLEIKDTIIYDYEINKTMNFANQFLTIKDLNNKNINLTKDSSSFINLKILNDLDNYSNPNIEKIKLLKFYENIKTNENTSEKNNEKKSTNFYDYVDSPTGPNVRSSLKSNKSLRLTEKSAISEETLWKSIIEIDEKLKPKLNLSSIAKNMTKNDISKSKFDNSNIFNEQNRSIFFHKLEKGENIKKDKIKNEKINTAKKIESFYSQKKLKNYLNSEIENKYIQKKLERKDEKSAETRINYLFMRNGKSDKNNFVIKNREKEILENSLIGLKKSLNLYYNEKNYKTSNNTPVKKNEYKKNFVKKEEDQENSDNFFKESKCRERIREKNEVEKLRLSLSAQKF